MGSLFLCQYFDKYYQQSMLFYLNIDSIKTSSMFQHIKSIFAISYRKLSFSISLPETFRTFYC